MKLNKLRQLTWEREMCLKVVETIFWPTVNIKGRSRYGPRFSTDRILISASAVPIMGCTDSINTPDRSNWRPECRKQTCWQVPSRRPSPACSPERSARDLDRWPQSCTNQHRDSHVDIYSDRQTHKQKHNTKRRWADRRKETKTVIKNTSTRHRQTCRQTP